MCVTVSRAVSLSVSHASAAPQCYYESKSNCEVDMYGTTDWYKKYFSVSWVHMAVVADRADVLVRVQHHELDELSCGCVQTAQGPEL